MFAPRECETLRAPQGQFYLDPGASASGWLDLCLLDPRPAYGPAGNRPCARIASPLEAGTAGFAFYDGLWVPLLRDGQSAEEAVE